MSQLNPYAPPRDFGMLPGAGPLPPAVPQGFGTREVLEQAWQVFKKHWPVLVAAIFLASIPGGMVSFIPTLAVLLRIVPPESLEYFLIYAGSTAISMVISCFFQVGFVRLMLEAARGKTPDFMVILSGFDRFFPVLATNLLLTLAICFGVVLLIVPGFIVMLGLSLSAFYCVDGRLGPIAALGASWKATRGHKGALFGFMLAGFALYFAGLLACCVGSLPASIVLYLGWAIIYIRLSGHAEAPYPTPGS